MHIATIRKLILFILLFASVGWSQESEIVLNAKDDKQPVINFEYDSPIKGIKFAGSFEPEMLFNCQEQFTGSATLTLTRLSDNKTIHIRESFGLRLDDVCSEAEYPLCTLKDEIIINLEEVSKLPSEFDENETDIKVFDYDFDNQDELLIRNPCGTRGGNDYTVYELNNEADDFSISGGLLLNAGTEIDIENQTMTTGGSSGACSSQYVTYKSTGKGYEPYTAVRYRNHNYASYIGDIRINNGCAEEKYEYESFSNQFILKEVNVLR